MTETPADLVSEICPYLGLAEHDRSRVAVPTAEHRCYNTDPASAIAIQHQVVFCLDRRHAQCSRYRPLVEASAPAPAARRGRTPASSLITLVAVVAVGAALSAGVVGNPLNIEPEPPVSGSLATAAVPLTAAATAPGSPWAGAAALEVATAAGTPPIAATPRTATNTPSPVPTPTPSSVYTVQAGDSLTALAARFGVPLTELAAANGLTVNSGIRIGQMLKIPGGFSPAATPRVAR